jgi:hypothetical protein
MLVSILLEQLEETKNRSIVGYARKSCLGSLRLVNLNFIH